MGRKRIIKLNEIQVRNMKCECGESVKVYEKSVVSVQCPFCSSHTVPLRTNKALDIHDKKMQEKEQQTKILLENNPTVSLSKNGKRLGRPPKNHSKVSKSLQNIESYFKNKPQTEPDILLENTNPNKKTRSTKIKKKTSKKIKSKKKGKLSMTTKGKRGRKATVGTKVMEFISQQGGKVSFSDILKIYSEERERLGKRNPDSNVEERNCRSTLYILVKKDGKLKEFNNKQFYSLS